MQHHLHHIELLLKKAVLLVTPVRPVADDRVQDMRHVLAKLMHPACDRIELYQ